MRPMIPRSEQLIHSISWQSELSGAITDLGELLTYTGHPIDSFHGLDKSHPDFPLRVPRPFADRIIPGDPNDPLLRQVLPLQEEKHETPGYISDPLDEAASNVTPGIIHKYQGRVLLILTGACAVNCRYCFRREFPYDENLNSMNEWQKALDYIRQDNSISEVIYSGGDPLLNSDKKLRQLTQSIADIPHIKRLRIHTRLPIVIPQRVNPELLDWLTQTRLKTVMVIHTNHANEIDHLVENALLHLKERGVTLLNQSVLLKGVNDSPAALFDLSERLFEAGVQPYYLHMLDKIRGAAHFDMSEAEAQTLVGQLTSQLPGYLVPKLVRENPGQPAKTLMLPRI